MPREPFTICGWCMTSDHHKCRNRYPAPWSNRCTCSCNDKASA